MEDFSGVVFWTTDQHVDARKSRMERDNRDVKILQEMLELKNPFTNTSSFVVSLGTGITGDETINCHMAKEVGETIIAELIGRQFINIKMKRSDSVRSLATITSTVKIKDKVVAIEPMVLYQRILLIKKDSDDLVDYFKYELAAYPLALFTTTGMRKAVKSALYEEFSTVDEQELASTDCFVIDGGYLLHSVSWKKTGSLTYLDVCNAYINYVQKNFKTERKVVVFDGYDDPNSIKESEHQRRNTHSPPPPIPNQCIKHHLCKPRKFSSQ